MKVFAGLAFVVSLAISSASASPVFDVAECTLPGGAIGFDNKIPNVVLTGTFTCPSASSIPALAGKTITGEFIVYNADYSNGTTNSVVEITDFSDNFSPANLKFTQDTITTTGGSNSTSQVSKDGLSLHPNDSTNFPPASLLAGFYDPLTSGFGDGGTVSFTNQFTSGGAFDGTGYVQVVFEYDSSSAPEPASMVLIGSGLLALACVARKKLPRR
jgi:hypothetical protein